MFKRIPRIKQRDATDCGPACLASVASHYGYRLPVARVRQFAFTDREGTNAVGMLEAAGKLGFAAKAVKGPFESLHRIPKPFIAHVVTEHGLPHYVAVYGVTRRRVTYMDPGDGRIHRVDSESFRSMWSGVVILLAPGEQFRSTNEQVSVARRFLALVRPHRTVLAEAFIGAAAYTILGLATAVYVQKIVDHVLVDGNRNLLNLMTIVMVGLILIRLFIGVMKGLLTLRTGQNIDAALIMGYYEHLLRLPQRFFDTMRVGDVISRVNDAVKIRAFVNDVVLELAVSLLVVTFAFGLMFLYSWKLALVVLAIVPAYGIVLALVNRANRQRQRAVMESGADLGAQLVESLRGISTLKRFGVEDYAAARTEARFVRMLRTVYRSGITAISAGNATESLSRGFTVLLLWVGAGLVIDQQLTPGGLMSFYTLLGFMTGPLSSLVNANRHLQDAMIATDRLYEILDVEREESAGKLPLTREMMGDITFDKVSFRFGSRIQVFRQLDLTIAAGRVTAIVGESGSGKSTLLALLQGLYSVEAGELLIGEYNIAHLDRDSLRRRIGVVPQEIELFSGSILENIALGDFNPDHGAVTSIASRLGILDLIQSRPEGFATQLDEQGSGLSGGEKQRLAIARALYRKPDILLLDEPTSALDPLSEQRIHAELQNFKASGGTVILASHRIGSMILADRIVVLNQGAVAEEGTHEELMSKRGAYYLLHRPADFLNEGGSNRSRPVADIAR